MNVGLGAASTAMPAHYYAVAAVTIILALFIMLGDLLILMFHQFCPGSYPFPLQYMPPPPYAMQRSLYEHEKIPPEIVIVMDASIIPATRKNRKMSKEIPVKEVEQHGEYDGSDDGEKKFPKDGSRRKSSSPPKSSKLPPVCLRVDPSPRRKCANGSSRSQSPPGDKQKPDQQSNEASKVLFSSDSKQSGTISNNEFKEEEVSVSQTEEKPKEENISWECSESDETVIKGQSDLAGSAAIGENTELSRATDVIENETKWIPDCTQASEKPEKSVVRELVSLQEKLDSLINKRSDASPGLESFMRHDEEALKETVDVASSQKGNKTQSVLLE
ncbi:hypothetical protein Pfo_001133 [Paulownia fortunei]|nr:hypothetical protein Pfo_001133 [Paulownia fortunei]